MRTSHLRRFAVITALVAALAGCGDEAGSATGDGATVEAVTVEHRLGTTEVPTEPDRVVTIDMPWTDVMLSMGIDPVGYVADPLMPDSGAPWQDLPADAQPLSLDDGVPVEQIAELDPDLIVGTYSIADQKTYELLSEIAPTVPALDDKQVTAWQDLTRTAGEILAAPERAGEVISSVEDRVATVADEHPALEGRTFALAQYIVGDAIYVVADESDGSSVFFQQLGIVMYPPVKQRGDETGNARINVSTERSDLLRSDLLVFLVNGGDEDDLADIPGFDRLPGTVAVLDYSTVVGLNTPSPLSVPYALDRLRPYLSTAAS